MAEKSGAKSGAKKPGKPVQQDEKKIKAGPKTKAPKEKREPGPPARLGLKYKDEVLPKMIELFGRKNVLSLPRLEKICLNMGVGKAIDDSKMLDEAVKAMTAVSGQAVVVTKARVSVSNFKLRQGYKIGCRVTLRGPMMWEFFDRLISMAIPRIRDFRGISKRGFDKAGNYSMGVEELTIFPEIDADRMPYAFGMDINFVIRKAQSRDESLAFLRLMGMPFQE